MTGLQDNDIIRQVLGGDSGAYRVLVERYQNLAFTLALKTVEHREVAEELTQDAFVKAYRSLADFKGKSKFATWLYTIVHTTCLSYLRLQRKPVVSVEPDKLVQLEGRIGSGASASGAMDQRTRQKWIDVSLKSLPEEDARIVVLFYKAEQSVEEIGSILGLTASNVKVRLFRARQKLRTVLQENLKEEAQDLYLS